MFWFQRVCHISRSQDPTPDIRGICTPYARPFSSFDIFSMALSFALLCTRLSCWFLYLSSAALAAASRELCVLEPSPNEWPFAGLERAIAPCFSRGACTSFVFERQLPILVRRTSYWISTLYCMLVFVRGCVDFWSGDTVPCRIMVVFVLQTLANSRPYDLGALLPVPVSSQFFWFPFKWYFYFCLRFCYNTRQKFGLTQRVAVMENVYWIHNNGRSVFPVSICRDVGGR